MANEIDAAHETLGNACRELDVLAPVVHRAAALAGAMVADLADFADTDKPIPARALRIWMKRMQDLQAEATNALTATKRIA